MSFIKLNRDFYLKEDDTVLIVKRIRLRRSSSEKIKRVYIFENLYIKDYNSNHQKEFVVSPYEYSENIKDLDNFTKKLGLSYIIKDGQNITWTKQSAFAHAKKFKKFGEFDRNAAGCYKYLKRNGWLDDAVSHMERGKQTLWTLEKLQKTALKHTTRSKLYKHERGAYNRALKDGVLDKLYP